MLIVVSPAKTLDYESPIPSLTTSRARLLEQSAELVEILKQKSPGELSDLMHISMDLAELNANRYQQWRLPFRGKSVRPAVFAFRGEVYTGLDVDSLSADDVAYAQDHLRILSGLYGLLRPLDKMRPYRLEMGTRLENGRGKNLYQFWGEQLTELLNKDLRKEKSGILVNLASNEYFKSLKPNLLGADVVTPIFKDYKSGQYKVVSFWAKKARGLMVRYIVQNRLETIEAMQSFNLEGYFFSPEQSTAKELVYLRDHPEE